MKYIDEKRIETLLAPSGRVPSIDPILKKARALKRLSLEETAVLLKVTSPEDVAKILAAARFVKNAVYGSRVVLFAPLYISNICANTCVYCAFKADNPLIHRRALDIEEIKEQTRLLLQRGHKRILMLGGESGFKGKSLCDYHADAVRAIYSVSVGPHKIKRVNVNCAPLSVAEFKKLKAAGIGTYQLFQETYHDPTYRKVHPSGPKSDPDNRIDAIDRAFRAGIDDVGIGVLYGLYDYKFEVLAMLMHIEHLEKKHGVGPHTISVPRIEPAVGSEFSKNIPFPVTDEEFKKLVAILRLSVPYTGIILSTRETAALRDELFDLGVSQVSAESRVSPGGYAPSAGPGEEKDAQFANSDHRCLDEVIAALIKRQMIPSFCAACYRKKRTGTAFMNLAKPGTIKGKCQMNALITLKEYLDDFASKDVRRAGYRMIEKARESLDPKMQIKLSRFFDEIEKGIRDVFV